MIYAFCGTIDEEIAGIRGNGKTLSATYFAYSEYKEKKRKIFANYKITFGKYDNIINIIDYVVKNEIENALLIFDEIDKFMNSLGSSSITINFTDRLLSQTRKLDCDIYYTTQRYLNVHKRLRTQTDMILLPKKYHYKNEYDICPIDSCQKPHLILVFSEYPKFEKPISIIKPENIGKLYNTKEFIYDYPDIEEIKKKFRKKEKE